MTSATTRAHTGGTWRVFVSSTSLDLPAHRRMVHDTLLSLDLFPVGMEHWGGGGDATSLSLDKVASTQVYVGIVAWRYGTVPTGETRSITHLEYEEAWRLKLPLDFIINYDIKYRMGQDVADADEEEEPA